MKTIKKIWNNKDYMLSAMLFMVLMFIPNLFFIGAGIISIRHGGACWAVIGLIFITGAIFIIHEVAEIFMKMVKEILNEEES